MTEGLQNPQVSVCIATTTMVAARIKGAQISGTVRSADELKSVYLKKFPMARLMPQSLWCVEIEHLKFTDNSLGIGGEKYVYNKNTEE